jgi:hypothetical protein
MKKRRENESSRDTSIDINNSYQAQIYLQRQNSDASKNSISCTTSSRQATPTFQKTADEKIKGLYTY